MSWLWTVVYHLIFSVLCLSPGSLITASSQGHEINLKILERGGNGQCASTEEKERAHSEIHQLGILAVTGHIHTCNGTPGWRRVAFINMTDTNHNCPTGLDLTSYSKRTCGRSNALTFGGCSSTTFSVGGLPYSRVCGRIRAYQFGGTDTFWSYNTQGQIIIDGYYVDGVSLTHGAAGRRQHIWTFAAGLNEENNTDYLSCKCPCDISRNYDHVPAFVGNDYFCESGIHSEWNSSYNSILFPDDVLWDGLDCTSNSTCCQFNNPPWFTKNLTNATTDDIELRICTNSIPASDDVPIELIELYVQ